MSKTLRQAEKILSDQDPVMGRLIKQHGPCRLRLRRQDPFSILIRAIVSQQVSTQAAESILNRMTAACGGDGTLDARCLLTLGVDKLRQCGLSNAKTKYTIGISELVVTGGLEFYRLRKLPDDAVIEQMVSIKGIGRWTAEMFLIFALGRLNVLSTTDVGLLRGAEAAYGLKRRPTADEFIKHGKRWRPYRSVASWYLWQTARALGRT